MVDEAALARAYNQGLRREKAGDAAGAAAAYRKCLDLDPEDRGGASVRLASLGLGPAPDRAPPAYVATLFDQNAEAFDDILVEKLGYAVPMQARALIDALGLGPFNRFLDLGCGTGLAALAMQDRYAFAIGVDLSEGILGEADERGAYDELYVGDAERFAADWDEEPFDLVTATDVLPYLGVVDGLFAAVHGCLAPGGVFVFSTETMAEALFAGAGHRVGPRQRFHHDPRHVASRLAAAGFEMLAAEPVVVRTDEGEPQPGHIFIARRMSR